MLFGEGESKFDEPVMEAVCPIMTRSELSKLISSIIQRCTVLAYLIRNISYRLPVFPELLRVVQCLSSYTKNGALLMVIKLRLPCWILGQ